MAIALGLFGIVLLALIVFSTMVYWKIFEKAGEPGWAVIVPIYNAIIMLKIVNKPWWWIFLMCIPIVNIVFIIMLTHRLSRSFGKDAGFTVGLLLLNIIFYAILAFDKSEYKRLED